MITPPPPCELTDAELAWLWPRFQRCTFPCGTYVKRFARNELTRLQDKGKAMGCHLAYQYRRQIFGKSSAKWDRPHFLNAVRINAAPPGQTAALIPDPPLPLFPPVSNPP